MLLSGATIVADRSAITPRVRWGGTTVVGVAAGFGVTRGQMPSVHAPLEGPSHLVDSRREGSDMVVIVLLV